MQFDLIPPQRAFQAKSRELARGRIADRAAEIDRTERPICEFQGVHWMLADMATQIAAAQLLPYKAAAGAGAGSLIRPRRRRSRSLYLRDGDQGHE